MARTNRESANPTRYTDQPAGWHGVRDWQATPVTSPVPPQAQPFLAEPSHFGSNKWQIGQLTPPLPSSSLKNNGPWTPSSPFPSSSYSWMNQPPTYTVSPGQDPQAGPTSSSRVQLRNRDNDRCHHCRKRGHWKAACPDLWQRQMAQGACTQRSGTRTYLGISVAGRNSTCLLDRGCELSMLPRRFVPTTPLEPTKVRVFAANGTKIPVMGAVTINFAVADIPVSCRFLVLDAVHEPTLGAIVARIDVGCGCGGCRPSHLLPGGS